MTLTEYAHCAWVWEVATLCLTARAHLSEDPDMGVLNTLWGVLQTK